ncbi:MAG: thioredoxin domain-containing protein, partial [Candidatus Aminicenantes bacterium]|nr:thioredoxin domain-containing protein [Candidatus Aminicenantes bacterium]
PIPHHIGFLLRYWKRTGRTEALAMAEKTLSVMRLGGIYDHLGFGFRRYSTDTGWLVPHFEKMLYDQALLAEVFAEAFAATGKGEFKRTAGEIADYVLRDLASPEGGFYTAEDADSEGEEGKFYLWTMDELGDVLGPEEAKLAARIYGLEARGNFSEPGRSRDGRNILHRGWTAEGPVPEAGLAPEELADLLEKIRQKLFLAREERVRPFKDTKVLADWNGLTIAALASVFRITGEDRYLRAAERAADFVLERMRAPDGRLLHVFAEGAARVPAFLDDYAFLVKGLVGLYEVGFDPGRLEKALELTRRASELLWDEKEGGFFFAAADPELGARRKEIYDGAVPSGNSVMLMNLLRLARLTGRQDLEEKASRLAEAFSPDIGGHPRRSTEFLRGLDFALGPSREVVVVGQGEAPDTRELLKALRGIYLPNTVGLFKPTDRAEAGQALERLAPFTKDMGVGGGRAAAYVCSGGTCRRPVSSAAELLDSLR